MESQLLLQTLIQQTNQSIIQVENLKNYSLDVLTWRPNPNAWNILECLEHLNLYAAFYLPEIQKQIRNSKLPTDEKFKSGFLGNYFAKSMLPTATTKKIKTFKDKNPLNSKLEITVIDHFIDNQIQLLALLNSSKSLNLNKIKTSISISKLIKLKLGDTFQFYNNHITRHLVQIEKTPLALKNI